MVTVELRKDGWFEAGKNAEGFPQLAYTEKQRLKKEITILNKKNLGRSELEEALKGIVASQPFKEPLYVQAGRVYVKTHGLPGECYLGEIIEKK